jgi:predicted ribosomally synthesized peptide with SipW-like signal peptide
VVLFGLTLGAVGTLAAWTDSVAVNGTTIGAARVDLKVQGLDAVSSFTALATSSMGPSAVTAGILTVKNNGTVPLDYYVTAAATNTDGKGLASALAVQVTGASAVTGTYPNASCAGTSLTNSATSFTTPFVGSAAAPRTLAAGATETLCVQAGLAANAATSLQNATTNVTFSFTAATNPTPTNWSDSVAVGATTISTPAVTTPVLNCAGQNKNVSNVAWASTNATSYEVHYGPTSSTIDTTTTSPYSIPMPGSGTIYIIAIYGNSTWMSGASNSRTYSGDGVNASTCN